jgi:hypothetical protein
MSKTNNSPVATFNNLIAAKVADGEKLYECAWALLLAGEVELARNAASLCGIRGEGGRLDTAIDEALAACGAR